MSTKSKHQADETKHNQDLAIYERLPEKKKELMELKHHDEKTTGPESVENTRKIEEKGRKSQP